MSDEIQLQVKEAIANAVKTGVIDDEGDQAFVRGSLVITLIELPRHEDEGPEAENVRLKVQMTHPMPFQVGMKMLEETATMLRMQQP